MQLLSLLFLGFSGCVMPPPQNLDAVLPEGYYKFDCPIVYKNGMVKLSHRQGLIHVQLLEDYTGSFSFKVTGDNKLDITRDEMDYPGLKRTFKGEGTLIRPGTAEGTAVVWLKSAGPVSRNHREGPWVLFKASDQEVRSFIRKQKSLEARKIRAAEAAETTND